MAICPFCNGLQQEQHTCANCMNTLQDYGKVVDYIDDYSAYMDQELLTAVDGLTVNNSQRYCMHVMYCGACGQQTEVAIALI
ncbi:hypothetical protein [Bacillus manliponensis]|uniref:Uncharacterized protein n=1 Tax=Bacillus manliponensis TaxID=574376 RepID=A0A073KA23_9BACI|nr:hypothetical protein [Bacillus manliponensis]KEK19128.1 hypothetical protein BAMA_24260 [Bacillus manliponensis]